MNRGWRQELVRYAVILVISAALASVLVMAKGESPWPLAKEVAHYAFGTRGGIATTLRWASPIIIAAMGALVASRVEVGNLGLEGQLYVAGLAAAVLGYSISGLTPWLHKSIVLLGSVVTGGVFAMGPAFLYLRWGVNPIVSSLMMNYVALWGTEFICYRFLMDDESVVPRMIATQEILPTARFTSIMPPYNVDAGIYIGIALCLIFFVLYKYTRLGYVLNVSGGNMAFARYGGVNTNRITYLVFFISGGLAGLAGATQIMGIHYMFINAFSVGLGWDGILVGRLAMYQPILVLVFGLFWGLLKNAGFIMERVSNADRWTVYVVQATMVLFVTADFHILPLLRALRRRLPGAKTPIAVAEVVEGERA